MGGTKKKLQIRTKVLQNKVGGPLVYSVSEDYNSVYFFYFFWLVSEPSCSLPASSKCDCSANVQSAHQGPQRPDLIRVLVNVRVSDTGVSEQGVLLVSPDVLFLFMISLYWTFSAFLLSLDCPYCTRYCPKERSSCRPVSRSSPASVTLRPGEVQCSPCI